MKAKVERGDGFRGVLDYALGKGDGNACEIVAGTMTGTNARDLAQEFGLSRAARPGVRSPVWHTSLSLPAGENIDGDRWQSVVTDFMEGMGLGAHQYVAIRHHDTDFDHVHIVASRVGLDGSLYKGQFDALRAIDLTQALEERHGLTRTKGRDDSPASRKAPSRNEIEQTARTGDAPPRVMLQEIVDAALAEPGSVFDFMDRIEAAGAVARPNVARTGKMNGFSFEFEGIHFKGSDLGKAYTWKGLTERGIEYEQDRDGAGLVARAGRPAGGEGQEHGRGSDASDRPAGPAGIGPGDIDGGAGHGDPPDRRGDHGHRPEGGSGDRGNPERVEGDGAAARGGAAEDADRGGVHRPDGGRDDFGPGDGGERGPAADRGLAEPDGSSKDRVPLAGGGAGGSVRPDDWRPVLDRVADLAAGADPEPVADRPDDPVSPAIAAKQRAWDEQHGALAAPAYRLTLMSRVDGLTSFNLGKGRGEGGAERFYAPAEVRGLIPYLSAHNARGRDIYLTPIDPDHHYLVVDDMTPESVADFLAAGYRPALVQESSAGNRQAVMKVPKGQDRDEQQAANAVVVDLNRRFGDAKFSGAIHPFRMAGFSNKKPGRSNAFTRLLQAAGDLCTRTVEHLDAIRRRIVGERPSGVELSAIRGLNRPAMPAASNDAEKAFDHARAQVEGLAMAMAWSRDESRIDYRAAQAMARHGWAESEIAAAILARSPGIEDRHRDPLAYAARTAESAYIDSQKPKNLEGETDPQGPDQP